MLHKVKTVLSDLKGQGLGEYALILGLIALACVAALNTLSGDISGALTGIGAKL
jgi:Flp pilus assembly pilin Flp